jgi:hypothetical protein
MVGFGVGNVYLLFAIYWELQEANQRLGVIELNTRTKP